MSAVTTHRRSAWRIVGLAVAICFGAYIVLTSLVGAILGVQGGNGWLAILYAALAVSMGCAAIVGAFTSRPLQGTLVAWSLVGIAAMAVTSGSVYLWFVTIPIAFVLLSALTTYLAVARSASTVTWAIGGAAGSVAAMVLLAVLAPHLPPICPQFPAAGHRATWISYPPGVPPWDAAEFQYVQDCLKAEG